MAASPLPLPKGHLPAPLPRGACTPHTPSWALFPSLCGIKIARQMPGPRVQTPGSPPTCRREGYLHLRFPFLISKLLKISIREHLRCRRELTRGSDAYDNELVTRNQTWMLLTEFLSLSTPSINTQRSQCLGCAGGGPAGVSSLSVNRSGIYNTVKEDAAWIV